MSNPDDELQIDDREWWVDDELPAKALGRRESLGAMGWIGFASIVAAGLFALAFATGLAQAGVAPEEGRSAFDGPAAPGVARPASAPANATARYQLRCWQYGQLVIEESGLELPEGPGATSVDGPAGHVRMRARDGEQQPLYLTETRNATCLVLPQSASSSKRR